MSLVFNSFKFLSKIPVAKAFVQKSPTLKSIVSEKPSTLLGFGAITFGLPIAHLTTVFVLLAKNIASNKETKPLPDAKVEYTHVCR